MITLRKIMPENILFRLIYFQQQPGILWQRLFRISWETRVKAFGSKSNEYAKNRKEINWSNYLKKVGF